MVVMITSTVIVVGILVLAMDEIAHGVKQEFGGNTLAIQIAIGRP